jgi:acetylornithine deacetylase
MEPLPIACDLISYVSPSHQSNGPISQYVQDYLDRAGFDTERLQYVDSHGQRKVSIVGRKGKGPGGFAYFAHSDVVPAERWFSDSPGPYAPTVIGNRLFGRGSCDMKGSLACMLAAVSRNATRRLHAPIYVTCTADEEIGYGGAKQVAAESRLFREMVAGETHAVIGEPTACEVVYAHKGGVCLRVTAQGIASHSSGRKGRNALLEMIPFLTEMRALYEETEQEARWQDGRFDPSSVRWNIGLRGTDEPLNVTQSQSVCTVYFRPMPEQDVQPLIERTRDAAERHGLSFDIVFQNAPLFVDPASAYVRQTLKLTGQAEAHTAPYGTDGCMFGALRNLVVLGPGDIAQAHTHDEWIALEQLERGTEMYSQLIQHWCQADD